MAAAGSGGGSARASPSLDKFDWMRRVLALPVSGGVVYTSCAALWAFTAGMTLVIVGGRVGGGAGDRVAAAGLSAVHVATWPLLLAPLAIMLFGMRASVSAVDSDSGQEPAPRRCEEISVARALWKGIMKDFKLVQLILLYTALAGCWMERRALGNGSFEEKAGAVLVVASVVGVAVISCFFVYPKVDCGMEDKPKGQ
ncbi:hypothetical protein EJB05_49145, partial [Eragrostis curvula]